LIVGFPPGGATDVLARIIALWLSERLGQQFVVENRPGAATNIATEAVVRAQADGYTLLVVTSANTVNGALYDKLSYDFVSDIAPVAGLARTPLVLLVIPSVPASTVDQFVTYAKASPGTITMASFGNGSISHLAGELFKLMTGTDMTHVPYRGSTPMLTDLLGGQVQAAFDSVPASIEHIRAGKLRPLAVTPAVRSPALPDIPTLGELLPGYEVSGLIGIGAPKNTPTEIIERLNKEINAGLADPKIRERLADLGGMVLAGPPSQYGKILLDEIEKWTKVIRTANIKAN
jgi:tripartite-type tricarboxylate transporter receptor subunit TctC